MKSHHYKIVFLLVLVSFEFATPIAPLAVVKIGFKFIPYLFKIKGYIQKVQDFLDGKHEEKPVQKDLEPLLQAIQGTAQNTNKQLKDFIEAYNNKVDPELPRVLGRLNQIYDKINSEYLDVEDFKAGNKTYDDPQLEKFVERVIYKKEGIVHDMVDLYSILAGVPNNVALLELANSNSSIIPPDLLSLYSIHLKKLNKYENMCGKEMSQQQMLLSATALVGEIELKFAAIVEYYFKVVNALTDDYEDDVRVFLHGVIRNRSSDTQQVLINHLKTLSRDVYECSIGEVDIKYMDDIFAFLYPSRSIDAVQKVKELSKPKYELYVDTSPVYACDECVITNARMAKFYDESEQKHILAVEIEQGQLLPSGSVTKTSWKRYNDKNRAPYKLELAERLDSENSAIYHPEIKLPKQWFLTGLKFEKFYFTEEQDNEKYAALALNGFKSKFSYDSGTFSDRNEIVFDRMPSSLSKTREDLTITTFRGTAFPGPIVDLRDVPTAIAAPLTGITLYRSKNKATVTHVIFPNGRPSMYSMHFKLETYDYADVVGLNVASQELYVH